MPIYTYECQSCSSTLERRQSFSDEPLKTHDECGGDLRRVIHPAGIVFKGSGFYNTDYKNGTASKKAPETADSKADGAKTDSGTNASAPASSESSNGSGAAASTSSSSSESKNAAPAAATP